MMILSQCCIFIVVLQICAVISATTMSSFNIPEPKVEILRPRGFRVSIPHEPGIMEFGFHGNLNRPMNDLQTGDFFGKVTKSTNGMWVYENRQAVLQDYDVIYYWLFVVKDNLGFIEDSKKYLVTDAPPTTTSPEDHTRSSTSHFTSPVLNTEPTIVKYTYIADRTYQTPLDLANSVFSTVENLTSEIKRLEDVNSILIELVEQNRSSSRNLTLKGMLPPYNDDIYVAQVVIKEKLGLQVPVVTAKKNSDGSITFEVASIDDKIKVIKAAKTNLKDSKIQLVY